MTALVWAVAAAILIAGALRFLRASRSIMLSAFTLNYALIVGVAGALASAVQPSPSCTALGAMVVAGAWLVYFGCVAVALSLFPRHRGKASLIGAAHAISDTSINTVALAWWALKLWLLAKYGVQSFRIFQLQLEQEVPLSYVEGAVNLVTNSLLSGAAVVAAVLLASRRLSRTTLALVASALAFGAFTGDVGAGVRRTAVALFVVYFTVRYLLIPARKVLQELLLAVAVGAAITVYYPFIRFNLLEVETASMLTSGSPAQIVQGAARLFIPNSDAVSGGQTAVFREGVAQLHCRLSETQVTSGRLSGGSVIADSLYIALPAFLAPHKDERDPDLRLAESFNLFPDEEYYALDLSNSPLIEFQADFGPLGWVMAGILQALALGVAGLLFSAHTSGLTKVLVFGLLWAAITSTEADMNQVVTATRDTLFLALVFELLRGLGQLMLRGRVRRGHSASRTVLRNAMP